ncbi:MAG: hypothetical protein QW721_01035 [Desulfurococcaceae archaeon]
MIVAVIGFLMIILTILSARRRVNWGAVLLGLILVLFAIYGGNFLVNTCNTYIRSTDPRNPDAYDLWLLVKYADGSEERLPPVPTQLIVTMSGKRISSIEWYLKSPTTAEIGETKLWLYWNKPLTLGVSMWEKLVSLGGEGVPEPIYSMSYDELREAVERHAGLEIPGLLGQSFEMDINVGVDVKLRTGETVTVKRDHLIKLSVSYSQETNEIIINEFRVSYVAQMLPFSLTEDAKTYLTPMGLVSIFGSICSVLSLFLRGGRR